ncbi:MAG: hypothetical protein J1F35_03410 [Erysipelotrichales bacterium]|nr:hypothetical protein [Erysipelotrichales bacterium]
MDIRQELCDKTGFAKNIVDKLLEELQISEGEAKEKVLSHIKWHIPSGAMEDPKTGKTFSDFRDYLIEEIRKNYFSDKTVEEIIEELIKGGDVDFVGNLSLEESIIPESDLNLNLNNNDVEVKPDNNVITVENGKTITITGDGTITSPFNGGNDVGVSAIEVTNGKLEIGKSEEVLGASTENGENIKIIGPRAITANGSAAEVVINNGEFATFYSEAPVIYVGKDGGKVVINNGEFKVEYEGKTGYTNKYLLNLNDDLLKDSNKKATDFIEVKGGTFYNFDPSHSESENPPVSFLASGYKVKSEVKGKDTLYHVVIDRTAQILKEIVAGGDYTLPEDIDITSKIALAKPTNLDLNNHTITNKTPGGDAIQLGAGEFTFKNGTIDNVIGGGASAGIYVNSSKGNNITLENMTIKATYPVYLNNAINPVCTIKSGTYISPYDKGVAVYVEKGGKAIIEGGYFSTDGHDSSFLLNLKDNIREPNTDKKPIEFIEVRGGTFVNFNPENNASEGAGTNYVPDDYIVGSYKEGENTIYIVEKYNNQPDVDFDGPNGATITWNTEKFGKNNSTMNIE